MVIQIGQIHSIRVSRSLNLKNVEVDGVMIGQSEQHALDALILQNSRQILISFHELYTEPISEVGRSNRLKLIDRDIRNSLMDEDRTFAYQR